MADGLFSDLYRYRQRANKNNLEDWLTECLAAVLRSLDQGQWRRFLTHLSGRPENYFDALLGDEPPEVTTQVQAGADYGIPDLVIWHRGSPIVLFENKVAHSVAVSETDEGQEKNQLHRYAAWLHEGAAPDVGYSQLVFLTHLTRPPSDFETKFPEGRCPYFGIQRRASTWGALTRHLVAITDAEGNRALSSNLVSALYQMLEEQNMANEFPDTTAIAALQVFLAQGGAIENLLIRMWDEVHGAGSSSNMQREKTELEFEFGRYTAHRYANKIERVHTSTAFLMTGLWFPEINDGWTSEDLDGFKPQGPQVFLIFADDNDDVFAEIGDAPSEAWYRPSSDFLRLKSLHEFTGSPDERATQILQWLAAETKDLREFLLQERLVT